MHSRNPSSSLKPSSSYSDKEVPLYCRKRCNMIYRILGVIYLSLLDSITEEQLHSEGITHILSIISGPPPTFPEEITHFQVDVTDEETSNLLQHFNKTNAFIDEAVTIKTNKILVHCAQGQSRSPTVIAAYLMYKYRLKMEQALYALKRKNPEVGPNEGFLDQLRIYQEMGSNTFDESNPLYKRFLIENSLILDPSGAGLKELGVIGTGKSSQEKTEIRKNIHYRCKRCRRVLATNADIESHEKPEETSQQSKFLKRLGNNYVVSSEQASQFCSHHFLAEPVEWMRIELENADMEGKLNCPNEKCGAKVGGYSWKGSRCSCGKWVIPALHLQTAKVDEVHVK